MRRMVFLLTCLGMAGGSALGAQEDAAPVAEAGGPKLTVHGYLTQAFAQSNGHQFLGITKDGTADYRTSALQLRADLSGADTFVVQLSEERLGASHANDVMEEVELDWLFYQHRWGDSSVRVGRVQIPLGFYNEVRDVGTLLPFYRPSHNFYGEGAYSVETIDGIVLSHSFRLGEGWGLDTDLHFGSLEMTERDPEGGYVRSRATDSLGAELWLDTPVNGLRLGVGTMRFELASIAPGLRDIRMNHLSVAYEGDRFAVHAEVKQSDTGSFGRSCMGNVHLGFDLTDRLTLNVQRDLSYFGPGTLSLKILDDDRALGVNFAFKPALVLKLEHHWGKTGQWLEDLPVSIDKLTPVRYWIVSLSTSF